MRNAVVLSALACVTLVTATATLTPALGQSKAVPAYAKSAIEDAARPAADKARDAVREPAAMLEFAGIRPGTIVAEYIPGGGYFTRIFSKAVGRNGRVYALMSPPAPGRAAAAVTIAADTANYPNVTVVQGDLAQIKPPVPVDVVWTSQNYHDLAPNVRSEMNKRAFEMLKPGGTYIVADHSAVVGTGDFDRSVLHRIDEALVQLEVRRAGFQYVGENNILRNRADPRTQRVFEQSLGRDTDQFILKFRKPR